MAELELKNVSVRFGGLLALSSLSFTIGGGRVMGLIGPNGAGKTTVFNVLTGVYQASEGDVVFNGESILGKRPYVIFKKGIARTFQNIRLFKDLSILDNIRLGAHSRIKYGLLSSVFRTKKFHKEEEELYHASIKLLKIFDLDKKKDGRVPSIR